MTTYGENLEFATELAREAGEIMKQHFVIGLDTDAKHDDSPVTIADTEVNQLVLKRIHETFPDHDVIGEEASSETTDSDYVWYCDPIDGTRHYAVGLADNVFSLGLTYKGKAVAGVIFDPYLDRMFVGEVGEPATLNGQKISVTKQTMAKPIYDFHSYHTPYQYPLKEAFYKAGYQPLSTGSVAYSLALLAAGQMQAVLFDATSKHDVVAAHVIVESAGASVSDMDGNPIDYNQKMPNFLAAHPDHHQRVIDVIKSVREALK